MRWGQELGFRLEDIAMFLHRSSRDPTTRLAHLNRMIDDRLAVLHEEIAQRKASIASLQLLRAIPFEGECLMPGAFVSELVRAHEERQPVSRGKPSLRTARGVRKANVPRMKR